MQKTVSCFGFFSFSLFCTSKFIHVLICVCVCVCARIHLGLRMLDVSLPVMMHQHVDNFFKQVMLLWAKEASSNLVNSLFQLGQAVVVLLSVVSEQDRKKNKQSVHSEKQKYRLVAAVTILLMKGW